MRWFFPVYSFFAIVFLAVFGLSCLYGYFFPVKYKSEIEEASKRFGVDEAVVYATINVESRFKKRAVSRKGAVGLMQILPSTAQELAQKLNMESYDLKNPKDNIVLGTYYLSLLQEKFADRDMACCAYNAGPANVSSWLLQTEYSEDGKTLKKIPFKETREYVMKFERSYKYYVTKI